MIMKKVICVDDSPEQRQVLKEVFSKTSYTVVEASDGLEGLKKIEENKDISLFVIDYHMPHLNGLEFLEKVRANDEFKNTPVIMFTTETSKDRRQRGRELNVSVWFVKPMDELRFLKITERIHSGETFTK